MLWPMLLFFLMMTHRNSYKAKPACEEITMTRDLPVIHPASFEERELVKRA